MKDFASGVFFILVGLFFGYLSLDYNAGTLSDMGPGFYPRVFSVAVIIVGVISIIRSTRKWM